MATLVPHKQRYDLIPSVPGIFYQGPTCHSYKNTDSEADEEDDVDHHKLALAQGIEPHLYRATKKPQ